MLHRNSRNWGGEHIYSKLITAIVICGIILEWTLPGELCPICHVSGTIRYVVQLHGHKIINYVDDFLEVGMPRVMHLTVLCVEHSRLVHK